VLILVGAARKVDDPSEPPKAEPQKPRNRGGYNRRDMVASQHTDTPPQNADAADED